MPASVVGRDAELAALSDFLAGIPDGARALVLEGEAGMGKTTLWRAAIEQAEEDGALVMRAQPAESETALSFSGLGDLLDPVLGTVLEPLPSAQRGALSRALLLDDAVGTAPDPHAVGVAVLNALRTLSEGGAVLVGVDDVQWLDAASAAALAYAGRRLGAERVGLLLARRSGVESTLVDDVRRSALRDGMHDVRVGPLDVAALHQIVQGRLGIALPRPLLAEVHQASGGNPFYALEIVRALTRDGVSVEAGRPLPVPDSLHDVVHDRLLALSGESRDFLAAAAAHAHPTISITEAASGVPAETGLAPALEAGIVQLDGSRIRFLHPLLAAGVLESVDPRRRAEIHARLAERLEDPEARAWQLAASVDEPNEEVAAVLEDAAEHARARGALRPAALLLDRAGELTPRSGLDAAHGRMIEAAYLHFESGDSRRAEERLRDILTSLEPGDTRERALWVLARIRTYEAPLEAAELFLRVVEEAPGDSELLAAAHEGVASSLFYAFERLAESAVHSDTALELARSLGDERLIGDVLICKLGVELLLGAPTASATADEALELQAATTDRRVLDQPLLAVAESWVWTDEARRGRDAFLELLGQADEIGDESSRPYLLFHLGEAECLLGELHRALGRARDGEAAAEQSGEPLFAAYNIALQCLVQAQLGDGEAEETARRALELVPVELVKLITSSALGHRHLAQGATERVEGALGPALDFVRREAIVEPSAMRFVVDHIEALTELGRGAAAAELLDWYEDLAQRSGRVSARANCARCRGLLAAQEGDLEGALVAFEGALGWHAQVELPLDWGRTLLALGAAQRRLKRRREARATLEEALGVFERIGAALWAERAQAELKRISGRAATPGALTPAEERVAVLVAEGKTNKEVAAALFLSDRTVEGHLARIFGKLGIRHRSEVERALQTRGSTESNTGDGPVSGEPLAP
jgi:DNA-binding CsgD family transcriptional regulator